jgi:hypothetical protein
VREPTDLGELTADEVDLRRRLTALADRAVIPAGLWDRVKADLATAKPGRTGSPLRRAIAAVVAASAIAAAAVWIFVGQQDPSKVKTTDTTSTTVDTTTTTTEPDRDDSTTTSSTPPVGPGDEAQPVDGVSDRPSDQANDGGRGTPSSRGRSVGWPTDAQVDPGTPGPSPTPDPTAPEGPAPPTYRFAVTATEIPAGGTFTAASIDPCPTPPSDGTSLVVLELHTEGSTYPHGWIEYKAMGPTPLRDAPGHWEWTFGDATRLTTPGRYHLYVWCKLLGSNYPPDPVPGGGAYIVFEYEPIQITVVAAG